jgi:hypothetical protein
VARSHRFRPAPVALVALLALLVSAPAASKESAPVRVVDRTFACTPEALGGARDLDVSAGASPSPIWTTQTHLVTSSGTATYLVFVRARAQERIGVTEPLPGPAGVFAHAGRCVPSRARVPLSSKGLAGPPIRFYATASCMLRGRVLVRVRAQLDAPAAWGSAGRPYAGAPRYNGAVKRPLEAQLAARSERSGKPLAFMTLDRNGGTRFWSAPGCR